MKYYNFVCLSIAVFCLFMSACNFCMELDNDSYHEACRKIDIKHKQEFDYFVSHVIDHNALENIEEVKGYLKKYELSVQKKKEIAFSAIKIKYDVSDSVWKKSLAVVDALYEISLDNQWMPLRKTTHDPAMPEWFACMIKSKLIEIGVNPQRVDLCQAQKGAMYATGANLSWSAYSDGSLNVKFTAPGSIGIDYSDLDVSDLDKEEGKCMLLARIVKTFESMSLSYVLEGFDVKIKDNEHVVMKRLHFEQSAFEVALENQRGAHCIRHFWKVALSNLCSVKHYKQLSKIEYCWKMLDWLQKYSGNNYHNIPLLLLVKKGDAEHSLGCLNGGMVVTKKIVDEAAKIEAEDSPLKLLVRKAYAEQSCSICYEHPEDMRDMPCAGEHLQYFICWQCYNKLKDYNQSEDNDAHQKECPICRRECFSYDKVSLF